MKINVAYTGHLKQAAGCKSEQIAVNENSTVPELLESISKLHNERFREILMGANNSVRPSILIGVNGERVLSDSGRLLKAGDDIIIMAPMAGG